MTARSYQRGHLIEYNSRWLYSDNKMPISTERPCVRCGKIPTPEGYDACLGYVYGMKSACCGHGITEPVLMRGED